MFVFPASKADRLKLLYWDGTGLVMAYKRLEEHAFTWPGVEDGLMTLSHAQFEALFSGLDGEALSYIAKYWTGLELFLTDGRIEPDNNAVERTIRPIALNRKNALFAGHDAGAENWAVIASLIETCKTKWRRSLRLAGRDTQSHRRRP